MATYILKRKTYSDEKQGMSTGKKLALGALGTAGLAAGGFAAAKRGVLGAGAMKSANSLYGTAGAYLKKSGATNLGEKMMKSGKKGIETAQTNIAKNKLTTIVSNGKGNTYTINKAGGIDALANKSGQKVANMNMNRWNQISAPNK